jgi:hypothetical protein
MLVADADNQLKESQMAKNNPRNRFLRVRRSAVAAGGSLLAAAALSAPAVAAQHNTHSLSSPSHYAFRTLDDQGDPTFNQLLGINNEGLIAGYFGSGQDTQHPNKGYLLHPNYHQHNFQNDNFPGSAQTQVTGLNNSGTKVGFFVDGNGNQIGFFQKGNHFTQVMDPNSPPLATSSSGTPAVGQLLGVNDHDVAVGFYTDANGVNHGYTYNVDNGNSTEITVPNLPDGSSVTASGINDHRTVVGFVTLPAPSGSSNPGVTESWVQTANGNTGILMYPDSTSTAALGINNEGVLVGDYVDVMGNMHGFTWSAKAGFASIDDPNGVGTTTINGVNDHGQLVGFYTDGNKNTDGFLATPSSH